MANFRNLSSLMDLQRLMQTLKEAVPLGKYMCQIVRDVADRRLMANIYVDQWPKFTTVISQEFTPRLSEVADLRIYTTEKERIAPLIDEANLLDNMGAWQLIHYVAGVEESNELSSYLLELFRNRAETKGKTSTLIFDYKLYEIERSPIVPVVNMTPGFYVKEIPTADAEFMAKYWVPGTIEYPLEHRIRFMNDTIAQFEMLGVYNTKDDRYPVSWIGQKAGGVLGIGYTLKEHRHQHFSELVSWELAKRGAARGNYQFFEFHEFPTRSVTFNRVHDLVIGHSRIIGIY